MKLKHILPTILLIISLSSCNKFKQKEQLNENQNSEFVKTWFDTIRGIPFAEKLEIKQNRTFKLIGGACTARWWSEGSWRIKNDTIILNSFKPKKCIYLREYGIMCRTFEEIRKNGREVSIKDCNPDSDNDYEMFINEKFYIKNDTLVHVKQNKKCEGIKVAYSTTEKIR
ncbi:hypothetical protein SGQ44_15880 [Flavobacterium sp. Fl-77]|uniref:Lipoprotein n=1 Tax=Flavobacterium flavipigmentatum TaxID=2893884 RepID=A0AAJ2VZE9_9FLAO|nr:MULTISPECIES: hypothetical protein [unclassified Flavobacterium]MDX6183795.1 hypothetical protein [Flavobacterium sp. Fl-33]MDX6187244.1 hypothetical protein [Flavobacterium sp. Fl-77]UFH38059.1 hypothetical protein LNP22_15125 [Flavobacterium sp. F-70]